MGVSAHPSQPAAVPVVGSPCFRELFPTTHPFSQYPQKGWQFEEIRATKPVGPDCPASSEAHLEPMLEPRFHQNSYGYRLGKSMHDAITRAKFNCRQYPYVLKLDIKSYFDTIPHDKLLQALAFYCKDKWVSLYVSRWLGASIKNEDGSITQPQSGTPQGGVISPLLSNLYLHVVFDGWMQQHYPGIRFERYADDIIIHCRREQIAREYIE